jgi:hypothetical protein
MLILFPLFLRNLFPNGFSEMITVPIPEAEIACIIASLMSNNSSGYDGISNKILKLCGEYLGRPLVFTTDLWF